MGDQLHKAPYEKRVQYILAVIDTEEKQRERVENKATVLIAAEAILLTAIIWLGLPANTDGLLLFWLQLALTLCALIAVVIAILMTIRVISRISPKQRAKIMNLPDLHTEYNLFFFRRIASFKKEDYQQEIDSLTEEEILHQLTAQAHNLARLLRERYHTLDLAISAFIVGLLIFSLVAVIRFLTL